VLQRGVHKSVQALEADIRTWIEHWNDDPRPFVWTRPPRRSSMLSPHIANESPAQDTSAAFLRSGR
jgi:hypothetical protein